MRWLVGWLAIAVAGCGDMALQGTEYSDAGGIGGDVSVHPDVGGMTADAGSTADLRSDNVAADEEPEDLRTGANPLIWNPGQTWNTYDDWLENSSETLRITSVYAPAHAHVFVWDRYRNESNDSWCSGGMVSRQIYATAEHCHPGRQTVGIRFDPEADTFSVRARLARLGVGNPPGTIVTNDNLTAATRAALEPWLCDLALENVSGGRDIEYYRCDPKPMSFVDGETHLVYPGDVFGYFDTTHYHPEPNQWIHSLSWNFRFTESTGLRRILLSPNGHKHRAETVGCAASPLEGESGSWSECRAVQRNDMRKNSSGGPVFRNSSHLVWALHQGHQTDEGVNGAHLSGQAVCHGTSGSCNRNYHTVSPITSGLESNKWSTRQNVLSSSPTWTTSGTLGFSTGTAVSLHCANDEAMIGIVGAQMALGWESTRPIHLANLAAICAPIPGNAEHNLDHAYAQAAGVFANDFEATPGPTSSDRVRFNRYRATRLTLEESDQTLTLQQTWQMCPAGMAVSAIESVFRSGVLAHIPAITCRPYQSGVSSSGDVRVSIPTSTMGHMVLGAPSYNISCPSNSIAAGLNLRVGWLIDNYGLRCRVR